MDLSLFTQEGKTKKKREKKVTCLKTSFQIKPPYLDNSLLRRLSEMLLDESNNCILVFHCCNMGRFPICFMTNKHVPCYKLLIYLYKITTITNVL